jgi:RNA polymerase sigma factor (sigma-70 family)
MSPQTDDAMDEVADLVERTLSGDSEAWGALYTLHAPQVFRLCRRVLPTPEDAEDATMEVFLKARLKLPQFEPGRPFAPWLYRVAANHCWDELRRRRARPETDLSPSEATLELDAPDPLTSLDAKETREHVRRALGTLGDRARLALVMRYYADLSYREIAEVLGVTPSFVGVLLLRARRELRRALAGESRS